MADKKACVRCAVEKAVRAFDKDSTRPDGRYPWCKLCRKRYSPKSQQDIEAEPNGHECPLCDTPIRGHANRRFCSSYCKDRVNALRKRFGLSVEQYRQMVDATCGRCPICGCRPRKWAVDHDHGTGLVTGVVCTGCNVGLLAHSRHDPARADALASYLRETPASRLGITAVAPENYQTSSNIHKMWQGGKDAAVQRMQSEGSGADERGSVVQAQPSAGAPTKRKEVRREWNHGSEPEVIPGLFDNITGSGKLYPWGIEEFVDGALDGRHDDA